MQAAQEIAANITVLTPQRNQEIQQIDSKDNSDERTESSKEYLTQGVSSPTSQREMKLQLPAQPNPKITHMANVTARYQQSVFKQTNDPYAGRSLSQAKQETKQSGSRENI